MYIFILILKTDAKTQVLVFFKYYNIKHKQQFRFAIVNV